MKFTTHVYADVSTKHITRNDGVLIQDSNAPGHLMNEDVGSGAMFYLDVEEELWDDFGFSRAFVKLMMAARSQGIFYICFDANGSKVEGATEFEW